MSARNALVGSSLDAMCPQCGRPAVDDTDSPHLLTDEEALDWTVTPGLYHDGCCPECNGVPA